MDNCFWIEANRVRNAASKDSRRAKRAIALLTTAQSNPPASSPRWASLIPLRLHREAHERCFIANSIKSEVRVEPGGAG